MIAHKKEAPAATGAVLAAKHQTVESLTHHHRGVNFPDLGRSIAKLYLATGRDDHHLAFERHMGNILQRSRECFQ